MKNNSFLSSEEIIKSFLSYLDDSIYSYAYLLDGSWGSGKTFFVKEILIPSIVKHEKEKKDQDSEYKEKRILYVSLYGIKETEEISRLLYLELRKVMADKMTTGRFLKKHTPQIPTWLGTTSKIVSDVIKDSKGIDIENIINKISTGFSLKNCIFIFDDLERTSCNVNDILGYINNFIEHDQVKVLLIANEAEINTASRLDVDPEELLVCLQDNLDFGFLESEENSGYNGSQSTTRSEKQKISLQKLMKRVEVVFARNQAYKLYDWMMMIVIVVSIIPLAVRNANELTQMLDFVTVIIFIIDYILRLLTADLKLKKGKKSFAEYPFTPMAVIDLVSILPSVTLLNSSLKLLRLFRLFRTFRVFRVFKVIRYSKSINIIINVFKKQREALLVVGGLAIGYIVISALIMFNVEPATFPSFFDAVYWATVSLTTVGYGDIYAVSTIGKVITMLSSVFGIAIVALPAGIVTAGYMEEINKDESL